MYSNRKIWTPEETKGLLLCYLARKEEFKHPRQKRNAYANVLDDMVSQGFTNTSTPILALEGRIRTLLDLYKSVKNNSKRTEIPASIAPYMDLMELIFGEGSPSSNNHTLNIGSDSIQFSKVETYKIVKDPLDPLETSPSSSPNPTPIRTVNVSKRKKFDRETYYEARLKLKKQLADTLIAQQKEFFEKLVALQEKKIRLLEEALKKER